MNLNKLSISSFQAAAGKVLSYEREELVKHNFLFLRHLGYFYTLCSRESFKLWTC